MPIYFASQCVLNNEAKVYVIHSFDEERPQANIHKKCDALRMSLGHVGRMSNCRLKGDCTLQIESQTF